MIMRLDQLAHVIIQVEDGGSLSKAVYHRKAFPHLLVDLTAVGE